MKYLKLIYLFLKYQWLELTGSKKPLPGGVLDPQVDLLLQALALVGNRSASAEHPVQELRAQLSRNISRLNWLGAIESPVAEARNIRVLGPGGEIPVRAYIPRTNGRLINGKHPQSPLPIFILYHGGGWVIGDLEVADSAARQVANRTGCVVVSVDYRLAPEHPFPAAVEDCYAVLEWTAAHAAEIHGDASRIAVGGDSAGGNLAAVVSLMARDRHGPPLIYQLLVYPVTDLYTMDTPSYNTYGQTPGLLQKDEMEWYADCYVPNQEQRKDPYVSPLLAEDLRGLPPALVITAEFDILRDEGEAYARRLEQAGVPVKHWRCNGMHHGFLILVGVVKRASVVMEEAVFELRNQLVNRRSS